MNENINSQLKYMGNFESDLRQDTPLPSNLNIIQIGKHCLPNSLMFDDFVNAPTLDLILLGKFLVNYHMDDSTRKEINKIFENAKIGTLWSDITKVIRRGLDSQESKLLYVFFSLQKYRFPQTSIDLESTRILIHKSNMTIAKIEVELNNRIQSLSEADIILKAFLENKGYAWEDYLYPNLAIKYLEMMQPLPLGMLNNINHDYTINSIAPSLAKKERIKLILESEVKEIEEVQMKEPENQNRLMELGDKTRKLKEEIIKLGAELTFGDAELDAYHRRDTETGRRLCVLSINYYLISKSYRQLSFLLEKECPEYFTALVDQQREKVKQKNHRRQSEEQYHSFHQCQFCYRYWTDEIPPNGEYPWHCKDRDECKKKYKAWSKHLNDSKQKQKPIYLSQLYW